MQKKYSFLKISQRIPLAAPSSQAGVRLQDLTPDRRGKLVATQLPSPRPPFPQTPSTTVGEPTLWRPWDEAEDGPGRRATPVPTIEVLATTQRYLRQLRPAAVKRPCSLKVFPEINSTGCGRFLSTRLGPADSGSQRRTARPLPDRNRLSRT